ncbi:glycosyltransferase [Paenibacillus mesophilus]|uniref:glycosyltransferase n=1 Tax=Paenibacillus mesophilus TaxID=2582849 RepID=UPI00110DB017|nr:glycosyltransferase [Paenibacillus mesophilus]TMV53027.1 glycosyltransferase [Paenibacillus mesophilus]
MNIAFCIPRLPSRFGALAKGRYVSQFIEALAQFGPEHSIVRYDPDAEAEHAECRRDRLGRFMTEHAIDLFVVTDPFMSVEQGLRKEWFGTAKVAALLLEWSPPDMKDAVPPDGRNGETSESALDFLRSCDLVLTPTEYMKQTVSESAGIPVEKIEIIAGGIDRRFERASAEKRDLSRFGIPGRYVLCAGTGLVRRQGKALITAFGMANRELTESYYLVIADDADDQERRKLLDMAEEAGIRDRVRWTGPVDGDELALLYGGAELFAYLGAEGSLGFPMLEAMACGTPVMAADRAEWNELGENAVYRVKPHDVEQVRIGLKLLLNEGSSRSFLIAKGNIQARKYQWRASAEKALRAFREACREQLAIFVSRHSARAGVPDGIQLLLPALTERYDCDLYIGNGPGPSPDMMRNRRVRLYRQETFPGKAAGYKAVLYQLDPADADSIVPDYMRQYPGIVLVEDAEPDCIARLLTAGVNNGSGEEGGERGQEGPLEHEGTFIVHQAETARLLEDNGCKNVLLVPKPVRLPVMVSAIMDRDFTFSSFGKIEPGDGLESVLTGLGKLVERGHGDVRLCAAGECDPAYRDLLLAKAESLGLKGCVEFLGPLGEHEYGSRISRSDVCLYLHHPRSDELSGDLLDVMSYGKPTVVLGTGVHLGLPDDVVYKTVPGMGEEDRLFDSMLQLYEDKELRKKMRKQARAFVAANHSVPRYANRVLHLIEGGDERECADQIGPDPDGEPYVQDLEEVYDTPHITEADDGAHHVVEVAAAPPAHAPASGQVFQIGPDRFRRIRKGKAVRCYFSFDLAALPPGVTIKSAVMHIPVRGRLVRVHRISSDWNAKTVLRRKPRVRPKPMCSKVRRRAMWTSVFRWDCTQLARLWQSGAVSNYGVYAPAVSSVRRPWLAVEYGGEGEET